MKICIKCGVEQLEENFSWRQKGVIKHNTCKGCHKEYRKLHYQENREKYISKARQWELDNGGRRMVKYRLDDSTYLDMLQKHNGMCWICQKREATCIDHDHKCCDGQYTCGDCIRGLLCKQCNSYLGYIIDDVDTLQRAMLYLSSGYVVVGTPKSLQNS